jgi:hypothetical protein
MTRAKDISKIVTDADLSGTLDVTGEVTIQGDAKKLIFGASADSDMAHYADGQFAFRNTDAQGFTFYTGSGPTERMRISSTGNVGIGTTSPTDKLHLGTNSGGTQLKIQSGSGVNNCILHTNGTTDSWRTGMNLTLTNGSYEFYDDVNNVAHMVIDNNGNVGIGTSSPSGAAGTTLAINGSSGQARLALKNTSTGDASGDGFQLSVGTDGSVGIEQRENNYMALYTNATERMRIDSSGNLIKVGGVIIGERGTASAPAYSFSDDTDTGMFNDANQHLGFSVGGSERMRIDSSGRMLLNTTAHTNGRLNVTENLSIQPCLGLRSNYSSNTGNFVLFTSDNGTGAGAISHINASTVAYNTSSDYRLKQNVTYDFDATTRLKQLQPARFSWNHDDTNTLVDGFIAHEVQEVVPEAITGTKDAVDADGNPVYQGIDQSKLVPLLVKTIQELEARIVALETA